MTTSANITVSTIDLSRLEELLGSVDDDQSPSIAALQAELEKATILEPEEMPADVVTMNSTVRFVVEPTGKTFELTLAYPKDISEHDTDIVSITAPIGSALLGLSIGQSVDWILPGGRQTVVRVVDVTYQPEREGNFHR